MRILWLGNAPMVGSGYGEQAGLFLPRLRDLGHDMAISASYGTDSSPVMWDGIKVYPKTPYAHAGEDVVIGHYQDFGADIVVAFLCQWTLHPEIWREMRTLHLAPVDIEGMSFRDYGVIANSGGVPAAVSKWGQVQMAKRGLQSVYLPHGVDVRVMRPPGDRKETRRQVIDDGKFMSLDGKLVPARFADGRFVVGINFMNNDKFRKFICEQFIAFAEFHEKHPDALLSVHSIAMLPDGYNLLNLCRELGIEKAVMFANQHKLVTGAYSPEFLAGWYGAVCDVTMHCGNEGFGLTRIESQACGTPIITAGWGNGLELLGKGAGWKVQGQKFYNDTHQKFWRIPFITSIKRALEQAYQDARKPAVRAAAREFAEREYDIDLIVANYWKPVLDDLGS